ncbi:DUF5017 domain-containing protein [Pedobacter arcticus]|uniref:DUF5017 domain-containing protein n=1 Tax=Pedobacter arcticus TaxID=752140 RepID=UPI000370DAB7|nr:DUF5017 domain-containing protein [Pedobacter arcticus]
MKKVSFISKALIMILQRKSFIFILFVAISMICACRDTEVSEPSFAIEASATTVNVGDSINFKFSGHPNLITFYSGEPNKEFKYRKRASIEDGKTTLEFSTTNAVKTTQANGFTVWVSTDFTGVNSAVALKSATWTDITANINLSTGANVVPSGIVDLNQYVSSTESNKPIFIAFRYNVAASAGQGTWVIKSFNINNTTPSRIFDLANIGTAGWVATSITNPSLNWVIAPAELTITGRGSGWVATEDWVVTKPLYINRIAPDTGLTIKDTASPVNDFQYAFETPGTYNVSFVAANANSKNLKETVKEITILVN